MIEKVINIIWQIGFLLTLFFLFMSSTRIIYSNIKNFELYKSGEIIKINSSYRGPSSNGRKGTFDNLILTTIEKDTVSGGTQKHYEIGDFVKLRYRGKEGAVIYEVNGKKIGSKYDLWDWLSPLLFLLTGFLLFRLIRTYFL